VQSRLGDCVPHVAPRAGAWIETHTPKHLSLKWIVAPRAGAWIETICCAAGVSPAWSPPARGRGLKLDASEVKLLPFGGRPPRGGVD